MALTICTRTVLIEKSRSAQAPRKSEIIGIAGLESSQAPSPYKTVKGKLINNNFSRVCNSSESKEFDQSTKYSKQTEQR